MLPQYRPALAATPPQPFFAPSVLSPLSGGKPRSAWPQRICQYYGMGIRSEGSAGSLDELPLSPAESLPGELDLGGDSADGSGVDAPAGLAVLPRSPSLERLAQPDTADMAGGEDTVGQNAAPEGELCSFSAGSATPAPVEQVSLFHRRGRRNDDLLQALREAMAADGSAAHEDEAGPPAAGRARLALASVVGPGCPSARETKDMIKATALEREELQHLSGRLVEGMCMPSPVARALSSACKLLLSGAELTLDTEVQGLSSKLLAAEGQNLTSKVVLADSLNIDRNKVTRTLPVLGAVLFHGDRAKRAKLEENVVLNSPVGSLLLYIDFAAYDETPLPVTMKHASKAAAPAQGDIATDRLEGAYPLAVRGASGGAQLDTKLRSSRGAQKVLQTVQESGMLLKCGDTYISIVSNTACPLLVLASCTGPALKESQLRLSGMSLASVRFGFRMRAVCTDRNASNLMAERGIARDRGQEPALHTHCEIHKVASVYTRTFSFLEGNVRGMIHAALSLRQGDSMSRFRQCLKEEIASRFEVLTGKPPREALEHKRRVLQLFVAHGTELATRQVLLVLCPNGDWRARRVQHYVPADRAGAVDRAALLEHVTAGLVTALCASQPELYPRHRWTGADITTDTFGVIESCHMLLSTTYLRYAASYESVPKAQRLLVFGAMLSSGASARMPSGMLKLEDAQASAQGGNAAAVLSAMEATEMPAVTQGSAAQQDAASWAEVNASHRRQGVEWVAGKPLAELILQRQVMEPLRQLLTRQFRVASEKWEEEQLLSVLRAKATGEHHGWGMRKYRLTVAASCEDEERFFEQLGVLFRPELWRILPPSSLTVSFQALAFRMLSRAGCSVHQLLRHPHKKMPFQLFRLLDDPSLSGELLRIPQCMWDAWSKKLLAQHPTLEGDDLLNKLALVGHLAWKDISRVEAKHATVRRVLKLSSTQTHPTTLEELSAQWCFLQARRALGKHRLSATGAARRSKVACVLVNTPPIPKLGHRLLSPKLRVSLFAARSC